MKNNFSLIWAEDDARNNFKSFDFIGDLRLDSMINMKSQDEYGMTTASLDNYFTLNKNTIIRRSELFMNLLSDNGLLKMIRECVPKIETVTQLQYSQKTNDPEANLYTVKETELFIDVIDTLYDALDSSKITSDALRELKESVSEIKESEEFETLKKEEAKLSVKIQNIKSVTLGVNLDRQFKVTEAGIISVNTERYVSGSILDKLLRLDFDNNAYTCITPLEQTERTISSEEKYLLNSAVANALTKIYYKTIHAWKPTIRKYISHKSAFLHNLSNEFKFILAALNFLCKLKKRNLPLCMPAFAHDIEKESVTGLYNPYLAVNSDGHIIKNDLYFDECGKIYILTGPNQGGKSIFLCAIGYTYALLHLGIPLPAESANINTVDAILTYMPGKNNNAIYEGRFADECNKISRISAQITEKSLFLFDEAFSSTGGSEAVYIAQEVLTSYALIGAKGIFATHLHELCEKTKEINAEGGKSIAQNLSAVIDEDTHRREFIIKRGAFSSKSYALDIARKYKLSKEDILSSHKK